MTQWIDDAGASLARMRAHGRLWVCQRLPARARAETVWEIEAEPGDTVAALLRKWAVAGQLGPLPRSNQTLQHRLMEAIQLTRPDALVVRAAHVLKGRVLDQMRLLAQEDVLVLLQGDVCLISAATHEHPSFFQRASYCVPVDRVFEV